MGQVGMFGSSEAALGALRSKGLYAELRMLLGLQEKDKDPGRVPVIRVNLIVARPRTLGNVNEPYPDVADGTSLQPLETFQGWILKPSRAFLLQPLWGSLREPTG
jgi:hypothetical protein